MRRIGRYILNGLTVLSLLLCVATVGLWIRSYHHADSYHWLPGGSRLASINSSGGRIWWGSYFTTWDPVAGPEPEGWITAPGIAAPRRANERFGIGWASISRGKGGMPWVRELAVSDAYLIGAFAVLPVISLFRRPRSAIREMVSTCLKCGYDLRATPDRCPECAAVPTEANR